jgi:hypothetical protein
MGRNVDISVDIILADGLNDSLGTLNVHILQGKVPGAHLVSIFSSWSPFYQHTWLDNHGRSG